MARSAYIYLLINQFWTPEPCAPVAAFTVKWELVRYLDRNRPWDHLRLYRMKDSPHPSPEYRSDKDVQEMDIEELMNGEL
jgi:hypothetical protein